MLRYQNLAQERVERAKALENENAELRREREHLLDENKALRARLAAAEAEIERLTALEP